MDDLKIKKTDFKEEHLTVDTLETAPEWFERFEDQMAMVGLSMTVDTGPSVEEQVKKARVKANAAQTKFEARETIEEIAEANRTPEQRTALRAMLSRKSLRDAEQSAKADVRDLEKKYEDTKRKVSDMIKFVQDTVGHELFTIFKGTRDEHQNNAHKLVVAGAQAIKDRLKSIAPAQRMAALKDKAKQYTQSVATTTVRAREKLYAINDLKKRCEDMQNFLGLENGALSDADAIWTTRQAIQHTQHGVGFVTPAMQDKIESAENKTWKVFFADLSGLLDAAVVKDKIDGKRVVEDAGGAVGHSFSATVTGKSLDELVASVVDERLKMHQQTTYMNAGGGGAAFHANAAAGQHGVTMMIPTPFASSYVFNAGSSVAGGGNNQVDTRGLCFDFQKNRCRRGDSCKFKHGDGKGAKALGETATDRSKKKCHFGAACKRSDCGFLHPTGKMDAPGTPDLKKKRT